MTLATARPRSFRLRLVALLSAMGIGLALLPAGIALADPPEVEGSISGTISGSDVSAGIPATLVWTETTTHATHSHPTTAEGWFYASLPYGTYTVTVSSSGYQDADRGPIELTIEDPDHSLDVTLDPVPSTVEGTIYGTITGSDTDDGIPATLVFTETTTSETHTSPTLDTGWYYANTLSYGTWTVSISSPGYQTANRGPFTLTAADPDVNLDVTLDRIPAPTSGSITVELVDADSGDPITTGGSGLLSIGGGYGVLSDDDHDGTLVIDDLDFGDYELVNFGAPGYHGQYGTIVRTLSAADANQTVSISLDAFDAGTASLAGTITAAGSGDPLDVLIKLTSENPNVDYPGYTKESTGGSYLFENLPAGVYDYDVWDPTGGYATTSGLLEIGDGPVTRNFVLAPAVASVEGNLVDGHGDPIDGVDVEVWDGELFLSKTVSYSWGSDEGYFFVDGLAAGDYTLKIAGPSSGYQQVDLPVTLTAGTTNVGEIELTPGLDAEFHGTILDRDTSAPVAGLCVALADGSAPVLHPGTVVTDLAGHFAISGIAPGQYGIVYWECNPHRDPGYITGAFGGGYVYDFDADESEYDTAYAARGGATIEGTLYVSAPGGDVRLSPTRTVTAEAWFYDGYDWYPFPVPTFHVDADGDYAIRGLPEGHYALTFEDTETGDRAYPDAYPAGEVDLDSGETVTGVDATFMPEKPTDPAIAVPTSALGAGTKDGVTGCATLVPSATCVIQLPAGTAGEYVAVFGHSTPVQFGDWKAVSADGTVTITVPTDFPAGAHKLVVQDANGDVIGWKDVAVPGLPGTGGGTGTGGKSTGGSKSTTGTAATPTPTPTPTVEPTAEPEPEASEEPTAPSDAGGADPEAQDSSVDAFPVGWVIGGGIGALLVIALIVFLAMRARRV